MRWYVHAVIRWQDPRTLEKRYYAQLQNGRRGRMSRRPFKTASQAKIYAGRWCERVNAMSTSAMNTSAMEEFAEMENMK